MCPNWMSTIFRRSSLDRRVNTITSSTRLRNSGRKWLRTTAMTRSWMASSLTVGSIISEPRFDVMISTVLVKSTVRPWPSVSRPSSSSCRSTLKTSGCAFSISSSSTTA